MSLEYQSPVSLSQERITSVMSLIDLYFQRAKEEVMPVASGMMINHRSISVANDRLMRIRDEIVARHARMFIPELGIEFNGICLEAASNTVSGYCSRDERDRLDVHILTTGVPQACLPKVKGYTLMATAGDRYWLRSNSTGDIQGNFSINDPGDFFALASQYRKIFEDYIIMPMQRYLNI